MVWNHRVVRRVYPELEDWEGNQYISFGIYEVFYDEEGLTGRGLFIGRKPR